MLPRLDAEERLSAASTVALGSGTMEKHEAGRLQAELRDRAFGHSPQARARPDPATLAAVGIEIRNG